MNLFLNFIFEFPLTRYPHGVYNAPASEVNTHDRRDDALLLPLPNKASG